MLLKIFRRAFVRVGYSLISRGWADSPADLMNHFADYAYLKRFLDQFGINCVLDVGANTGGYAQLLRRVGYRGQIVSFEPNPDAFLPMSKIFRDDPHWNGFQLALGSARKSAGFHVGISDNESSFLERSTEDWIARVDEVEVMRLDSLFTEIVKPLVHPRVLLKLDTQGYDLEVIEGAKTCLEQIIALQSEISVKPLYQQMPHYTDALALYESLGYSLMHLAPVLRGKKHGNIVEYDAVMARLPD